MKMTAFMGTAARETFRQPLRSLLAITAIAISGALLVTLASLGIESRNAILQQLSQGDGLKRLAVTTAYSASSGLFESNVQVTNSSIEKLDTATASKLASLQGVQSVSPQVSLWELQRFSLDGNPTEFVASVTALEQLPESSPKTGQWYDNSRAEPQVVLGNGYAKALGYSGKEQQLIGKTLNMISAKGYRGIGAAIPGIKSTSAERTAFNEQRTTIPAKIVGVSEPSFHDNQLYVPYAWAVKVKSPRSATPTGETSENLIDKQGFNIISVTANSDADVKSVADQIKAMGLGVSSAQKYIDQINQLSVVVWLVLGSVAIIALISSALGIVNTLLMTITEQARTIGIWRACGAKKTTISLIYINQAALLGIIGACIGVGIGAAIATFISSKISAALAAQGLQSMSIPSVSPFIIAASIAAITLLAILAGIYPARRAAKKSSQL